MAFLGLARSRRDFIEAPHGGYIIGRSWLVFSTDRIAGISLWGTPSAEEIDEVVSIQPFDGSALDERRPRLVDLHGLVAVEPPAFARLAEFLARRANELKAITERVAIVYRGEFAGTLATGLPGFVPMPYEMRLFTDTDAALDWLEFAAHAKLAAELDELQGRATGTPPLVRDLRARIAASLKDVDVANAAAAVALSPRSLQRKLRELGTSFQRELDAVRIDRARELLDRTALPIAAIARDVGFATPQQLSVTFRKLTGKTPRAWRSEKP